MINQAELAEVAELAAKWPRAQFERWKTEGLVPADESYESYLEMRREQEESARQQRLEIFGSDAPVEHVYQEYGVIEHDLAEKAERERREFYGDGYLQGRQEEPPELMPEDEAALDRAWAAVTAEMAAAENKSHPQRVELGVYIVSDPEICSGDLIFKDTHILVNDVLSFVAQGYDWKQISAEYDGRLSRAAIAEAVELARQSLIKETEKQRRAA